MTCEKPRSWYWLAAFVLLLLLLVAGQYSAIGQEPATSPTPGPLLMKQENVQPSPSQARPSLDNLLTMLIEESEQSEADWIKLSAMLTRLQTELVASQSLLEQSREQSETSRKDWALATGNLKEALMAAEARANKSERETKAWQIIGLTGLGVGATAGIVLGILAITR